MFIGKPGLLVKAICCDEYFPPSTAVSWPKDSADEDTAMAMIV